MARKSQKSPTEAQIIRSQTNYARRMAMQPFSQAAKAIGKTERQIKNYMYNDPKKVVRNFWRNATIRELYLKSLAPIVEIDDPEGKRVTTQIKDSIGRVVGTKSVPAKIRVRKGRPIIGGMEVPRITREGRKFVTDGSEEEQRLATLYARSVLYHRELPDAAMSIAWQKYTSERGLPTSIDAIKEMYADGEFNKRQAGYILNHWHAIYSDMSADWFADTVDSFAEYDELRD